MQRSGKSISLRVCNSTAIHTYTPWETPDRWYGGMTKMGPEAVSGVAKPMKQRCAAYLLLPFHIQSPPSSVMLRPGKFIFKDYTNEPLSSNGEPNRRPEGGKRMQSKCFLSSLFEGSWGGSCISTEDTAHVKPLKTALSLGTTALCQA